MAISGMGQVGSAAGKRRHWRTRDDLRIAIVSRIERAYDRRRRQTGLGWLTPIEFEIIMTSPAIHAA